MATLKQIEDFIAAQPVAMVGVSRNPKKFGQMAFKEIIMTKKDQTAAVVKEARNKGIKNIWIQQNSDSKEAIKELEGSNINYITGECILMYHKPHGFHKFHRAINKFFGKYPK
jgi:predicted CoA-binding protein